MRDPLPDMAPVSKDRPCPACKRTDRCKIGLKTFLCWRVPSERPIKGGAGWIHRLEGDLPASLPPPKRERIIDDWTGPAMQYANGITPNQRRWLESSLGLPEGAMNCIGLLGAFDDGVQTIYTFPERDGSEKVIGLNRRLQDGRKKQMAGSQRGLTIPNGWDQGKGPLFIVEGPTDTAAMIAAGLCAWGRPSNTGGVQHLADALSPLPEALQCVIVGENDKKADGLWPGLAGAVSVAGNLQPLVKQTVRWTMAPLDYKDVREYLTSEMFARADWTMRGEYLLEELLVRSNSAEHRPHGYAEMIDGLKKTVGFDEERWRY